MVNTTPIAKPGKGRRRYAKPKAEQAASDGAACTDDELAHIPMDDDSANSPSEEEIERSAKLPKTDAGVASASAPVEAAAALATPIPPTAPTAPTAEPSMGDLLAAIGNITTGMGHMNTRFDAFEARCEGSDRKIAAVCSDLKAFQAEVTAKFAAIQSTATALAPPTTPKLNMAGTDPWARALNTGSSSSGTTAAAAPAAPAAPAAKTKGGRQPTNPSTSTEFGRKIIALGFPRILPGGALRAWWEANRTQLPHDIYSKATFQGGSGKSFMLVFPTREDARALTKHVSVHNSKFSWTSPRSDGGDFPIHFKTERTIPEQERGQAMSGAWRILAPLVKESLAFNEGMKFTTDPRRGFIAVTTAGGSDMYILMNLKSVDGVFSITTVDESFTHFGIPLTVAEAVRTSIAPITATK
jgi:hypothetical protein